jgi:hypothetical protein
MYRTIAAFCLFVLLAGCETSNNPASADSTTEAPAQPDANAQMLEEMKKQNELLRQQVAQQQQQPAVTAAVELDPVKEWNVLMQRFKPEVQALHNASAVKWVKDDVLRTTSAKYPFEAGMSYRATSKDGSTINWLHTLVWANGRWNYAKGKMQIETFPQGKPAPDSAKFWTDVPPPNNISQFFE